MKEEKEKKPLIICQNRVLEVFIDVSKYLTHEAGAFVKNIHLNNKVKVKKKVNNSIRRSDLQYDTMLVQTGCICAHVFRILSNYAF